MVDEKERLKSILVGQDDAVDQICEAFGVWKANLAADDRPAGVFLLLGPTGVGKTKFVESLASVLHGRPKMVKLNCSEFAQEHETAKLLGSPPGYLGHRSTMPLITQEKLSDVTSAQCSLSIVLFDEIEKANSSFHQLMLGVFDKGTMNTGSNETIDFRGSMIFMTSNLGARKASKFFGYSQPASRADRLRDFAEAAAKKRFSPEFVNRVDSMITFRPLGRVALAQILDLELEAIQTLIVDRKKHEGFAISVPEETRDRLLDEGTSLEYGARELKRVLRRRILVPLSDLLLHDKILPGAEVTVRPDFSMGFAPAPMDLLLEVSIKTANARKKGKL